MAPARKPPHLTILLIILQWLTAGVMGETHFHDFFPQLKPVMEEHLHNGCREEYQNFLDQTPSDNVLSCTGCSSAPLTDCLLNTIPEVDKANMASAAVILGILPTSLSLAGSTTTETGLLSLRRPLLAFLIGAGAPAVSPTRTFTYTDPKDLMRMRRRAKRTPQLRGIPNILALVLEYCLASAAVANLGIVSWQLCVRTICSFAQDTIFMPALWAFLAAGIHITGAVAVSLRVALNTEDRPSKQRPRRSFCQAIRNEFKLSRSQSAATLDLDDESYWFLLVSWITSSATVVHIIYGTLVFSSLLFITTMDAVIVVFRLLGSTIVCRAILMFELSGMREVVNVRRDEASDLELGGRKRFYSFGDAPPFKPRLTTQSTW